jgi:hypothetical protein
MAAKARFICAYGDACMCRQLDCNLWAPSTRINSVTEKAQRRGKNRSNSRAKERCRCVKFIGMSIMSQSLTTSTNSIDSHNGASDLRMLAQVEKWMAMIREINRERPGAVKMPAVG